MFNRFFKTLVFRLKVRGERLKARSFYRFALNYFYIVARGRGIQLIVNIFCGGAAGIFYRNNIQMITSASGIGVVTGKLAGDQQQIYRIGFSGFSGFLRF